MIERKYAVLPLLFLSVSSIQAYAYGFGLGASHVYYENFRHGSYAYSSVFPQGRDRLHWLDLTYADYGFILAEERGQAREIGTLYRFSQRLRWSRYFKPYLSVGFALTRTTQTERIRVKGNIFRNNLSDKNEMHARAFVGVGYLWSIRDMVLGFSLDYGHEGDYAEEFVSPAFFFALFL